MKNICILGSTGSIGTNAIKVIGKLRKEFSVKALAAKSNIELLEKQAKEFHPDIIAVYDKEKAQILKKRIPHIKVVAGLEGLQEAASHDQVDIVLSAISGTAGLIPTLSAIEAKKQIGLANKEVLVSAGELVMKKVEENGVCLVPIDSEHSAIFQCLRGEKKKEIKRLVLTASGGPFHKFSEADLAKVTSRDALSHPTYLMGAKNTIDSSTLMNKGLEVIEASFLFGIPFNQIDVTIHPQSIIHSMVEFIDGSVMAQISEPNMQIPIQFALTYPKRKNAKLPPFDFSRYRHLEFYPPDTKKFPCLSFAYEALKTGKSMPCFMNGVNEVLVENFLKGKITWKEISRMLERLMSSHRVQDMLNLNTILEVDALARQEAYAIL